MPHRPALDDRPRRPTHQRWLWPEECPPRCNRRRKRHFVGVPTRRHELTHVTRKLLKPHTEVRRRGRRVRVAWSMGRYGASHAGQSYSGRGPKTLGSQGRLRAIFDPAQEPLT
jgi:hypothetical protein